MEISHVSHSSLSALKVSPQYFQKYINRELKQDDSRYLDLGSAIHCYILENSTFNDKYMIQLNTFSNNNENLLIEINKTIDWTVLYNTLNMKWMEFDLFGIEIQSFSSISRIILGSTIIYKLYN